MVLHKLLLFTAIKWSKGTVCISLWLKISQYTYLINITAEPSTCKCARAHAHESACTYHLSTKGFTEIQKSIYFRGNARREEV